MKRPAIILGVPIDDLTMASTIERLGELIVDGRRSDRNHQVATVNVDFLVNALRDDELLQLLQGTALNLPDGMPLIWAARLLGTPLPERVAGADLVPLIAKASADHGWRVHLFGGAPGVADRARTVLLHRYAQATITVDSGPSTLDTDEADDAIIAGIRAADPDVMCVALGNPKQERFIARFTGRVGCPVMIGIGGSLDMLVGDRKRAPELIQRVGAEWVYRAAQEPTRLGRRYAHDVRVFVPQVASYANAVRSYRNAPALASEVDGTRMRIRHGTGDQSAPILARAGISRIDIDLAGLHGLNPSAHALVIGVLRQARLQQIPVTSTGIGTQLRRCFESYRTWPLMATTTT